MWRSIYTSGAPPSQLPAATSPDQDRVVVAVVARAAAAAQVGQRAGDRGHLGVPGPVDAVELVLSARVGEDVRERLLVGGEQVDAEPRAVGQRLVAARRVRDRHEHRRRRPPSTTRRVATSPHGAPSSRRAVSTATPEAREAIASRKTASIVGTARRLANHPADAGRRPAPRAGEAAETTRRRRRPARPERGGAKRRRTTTTAPPRGGRVRNQTRVRPCAGRCGPSSTTASTLPVASRAEGQSTRTDPAGCRGSARGGSDPARASARGGGVRGGCSAPRASPSAPCRDRARRARSRSAEAGRAPAPGAATRG